MTPDRSSLPLTIRAGRSDDMRAEILVHVTCGDMDGGERVDLEGTLVGPRRGRDMTLPTTVKLADITGDRVGARDAAQAVARAVFTEPAYWTPELPNLYRLEARVHSGDRTVAVIDRMIGLRRLGVRGRSLWLEGRRWVPRGVTLSNASFDPAAVRGLFAAAVINDPSDAICAAADQAGVAIIAVLRGADDQAFDRDTAARRIAAWALHPSVVLAVVPRLEPADRAGAVIAAARSLKGTMLIGLEVNGTQPPDAVPAAAIGGVDCLVVSLPCGGLPHEEWRSWRANTPLVAWRAVSTVAGTPAEHRQECDRLQAALAAWGCVQGTSQLPWDWAGYCCLQTR